MSEQLSVDTCLYRASKSPKLTKQTTSKPHTMIISTEYHFHPLGTNHVFAAFELAFDQSSSVRSLQPASTPNSNKHRMLTSLTTRARTRSPSHAIRNGLWKSTVASYNSCKDCFGKSLAMWMSTGTRLRRESRISR